MPWSGMLFLLLPLIAAFPGLRSSWPQDPQYLRIHPRTTVWGPQRGVRLAPVGSPFIRISRFAANPRMRLREWDKMPEDNFRDTGRYSRRSHPHRSQRQAVEGATEYQEEHQEGIDREDNNLVSRDDLPPIEELVEDWTAASVRNINKTLQINPEEVLGTSPDPVPRVASTRVIEKKDSIVKDAPHEEVIHAEGPRKVTLHRDLSLRDSVVTTVELESKKVAKTSDLIRFAVSTVGIYWASPLMSLIDTSAVGTCASRLSLAALGPASILCDYAFYINTWIGIAMTNLHARAVANKDREQSRRVIRAGITLAVTASIIVTGIVQGLAPWMILAYSGEVGSTILDPALEYMRIRSLGYPATLVTMTAQAALLSSKSVRAPLLAVAVEAFLNFWGDMLLVRYLGLGIGGAAWATVVSQYAGMALILPLMRRELGRLRGVWKTDAEAKRADSSLLPEVERELARSTGKKAKGVQTASREFLDFAIPVGTTLIGKLVTYLTLTHVAASFGVVPLASHQVMLALFYALTPFCDTIGNTAQTFLPAVKNLGIRAQAELMKRLTIMGLTAGAGVSLIAGSTAILYPQVFTSDPGVGALMANIAPLTMACLVGHGALLAAEGWMLASDEKKDRRFLGKTYGILMAVVPISMAAVKITGGGILNLWKVFAGFQLSRLLIMRARLRYRIRQEFKKADSAVHRDVPEATGAV